MIYALGFIGLFVIGAHWLFLACSVWTSTFTTPTSSSLTSTTLWLAARSWVTWGALHFCGRRLPAGSSESVVAICRCGSLHRLQSDVLSAIYSWLPWHAPALSHLSAGISSAQRAFKRRRLDSCAGLPAPMSYLTWSMRYGRVAGQNPWPATGLEWKTDSPRHGKF